MHIGSGSAVEVELSLDILLDLVNRHVKLMAPFAVFTKVGSLQYHGGANVNAILC